MLITIVTLLAAAVLLVSLTKRLGFGSILGYLVAGVAIGPSGFRLIDDVHSISEISELGVLMLLFLIGLELRVSRIWAMRRAVFGLGGAQVAVTGSVLTLAAFAMHVPLPGAAILGIGLALSSTAIVLPLLAERNLLAGAAGRDSFSVLLFQDLASIPLIAIVPVLAGHSSGAPIWPSVLEALAAIGAILIGGRFLVRPVFRVIGGAKNREVFTATALLLVVSAAAIVGAVGLPLSLGAFAAGVVLSESEYRHELQADIEPFEGLLLGLFFMTVGMSANVALAIAEPGLIAACVVGLVVIKAAIAFTLGRIRGQSALSATRFAFAISQGSEFAFVLFGVALAVDAMATGDIERATLVVALSMLISPVLFAISERFLVPHLKKGVRPAYATPDAAPAPVIICGFGRFGQVVGRVLRARGITFNALDAEPAAIEIVKRFGYTAFYGDATRLDLLRAVGAEQARVIVVAIPGAEDTLKIVELVKKHFGQAEIYVRSRNRQHTHRLMDAGANEIVRETFFSSLRLSELVLQGLDFSPEEAKRTVATFRERDEQMLLDQHDFYADEAKLAQTAKDAAIELRELFEADKEQ